MEHVYIISSIIVAMIATMITRFFSIMFPEKIYEHRLLKELNKFFPLVIITLLVFYSVIGANWNLKDIQTRNFAYPEILGIIVTALVHLIFKRNAFLSIISGTAAYIFFNNLLSI